MDFTWIWHKYNTDMYEYLKDICLHVVTLVLKEAYYDTVLPQPVLSDEGKMTWGASHNNW